jgi:hypothetical protein
VSRPSASHLQPLESRRDFGCINDNFRQALKVTYTATPLDEAATRLVHDSREDSLVACGNELVQCLGTLGLQAFLGPVKKSRVEPENRNRRGIGSALALLRAIPVWEAKA